MTVYCRDISMEKIDLKKISQLLSQKLGATFDVHTVEKAGSGFHSDGFKLIDKSGREFFLKRLKSYHGGFEFPERRISSLLVSDSMARRANSSPMPVGVIVTNDDHAHFMHELDDGHIIYHVQEFEASAKNYLSVMDERAAQESVSKEDREELAQIVDLIAGVHAVKHASEDASVRAAIYNDGIRSPIIHPELTYALLQDFADDHSHLPLPEQSRYLGLMWENVRVWKDRTDRLSALHGDFWGANVFFRHDGSVYAIDYSRIPWGDPGIDVGWWLSQYLWRYHKTGNPYFKELGEEFLNQYSAKMGDTEIRKAVTLAIGFTGLVNIYPHFHPEGLDKKLGDDFLRAVYNSLESKEFRWE